jgi:hypothetical protein
MLLLPADVFYNGIRITYLELCGKSRDFRVSRLPGLRRKAGKDIAEVGVVEE